MSGLDDISVEIAPSMADGSSAVLAVLSEIQTRLAQLIESGQNSSIDLRSLPLLPGDHELLAELLGEGEVTATVQALGPTVVHETSVPGVWWVTHLNSDDEVMGEFIEVTDCPDIIKTQPGDLQESVEQLQAVIADASDCDAPEEID